MIESKSMKVATAQEQDCIDTMADFGWGLKSSQEINVRESHVEYDQSVITHENYVKLVFTRDTAMKNYDEIKQLEATYSNIAYNQPDPFELKKALKLMLFLIFPGVLYIINNKKANVEWASKMQSTALPARDKAKSLVNSAANGEN